ncbi:MAG: hypothetical protein QNL33_03005 [Akkermansiaceae bacterium]|jgi:hypothetical protein
MKKTMQWLAVVLVPVLMISPSSAQETKPAAAEKTAEATIPTVTFYYYDG